MTSTINQTPKEIFADLVTDLGAMARIAESVAHGSKTEQTRAYNEGRAKALREAYELARDYYGLAE